MDGWIWAGIIGAIIYVVFDFINDTANYSIQKKNMERLAELERRSKRRGTKKRK